MKGFLKKAASAVTAISVICSLTVVPQSVRAQQDAVVSVTFDTGGDAYSLHGAVLEQGRDGNAVVLDGVDDYADIGSIADKLANIDGDFTISVWCKPAEITLWSRVFDFGNGSSGKYIFLTPSSGVNPRFVVTTNGIEGEEQVNSGTQLTAGAWHHIAITSGSAGCTMYIDGILQGTAAALNTKLSDLGKMQNYYLGKSQFETDPYFKGLIDDFKVFDYALTEEAVQELAAEAYQAIKNQKVFENNCYIVNTRFYNNNDEIFAYNGGDLTVKAAVENDTANAGEVSVSLYADDVLIAKSDNAHIASLQELEFTLTAEESALSGAEKLVLKIDTGDEEQYNAAELYCGIIAPVAAPADSKNTTEGAHDPSIVQFPGDDTFYVYSSHHLIFKSEDLINWEKYDFTSINARTISPKTAKFISDNYTNTVMNDTYWAPDVIYKEDDDHPYWMYISLSCGLGGRNSAIALMKSDSPLFWADSQADIEDAGIVFATKENSSYKTNAIDANIYTDSDGEQYFVWGSFWKGIQAAKLKADGFVEGIDYTSDSTILSSCADFGKTVYAQRNGIAGPEGAWTINHGGYRYMMTSYGWLGSNYNTRIARSSLSTSFAQAAAGTGEDTSLVDANGYSMGTQYSKGSVSAPSGYKLIGSYRLGEGSYDINEVRGSNNSLVGYAAQSNAGDAYVYYGPGHNSAINVGDEAFYCSHTRKNAIEIAATLQIRKMLFTKDGWPVVSPVTYAGEKEQPLPEVMIPGTYDLASVGHTKMNGTSVAARNFDLPVFSSKVTLNADGTMANGLGTWTFDNDHTVTLKFLKDGDAAKDEFYKYGDIMTLMALYSYDKDEREPVLALTGTDQNHITQFAKKSMANVYKTPVELPDEPAAVSVAKSTGGNPELGFDANGNILYGGDPAATVIGDTVYLIVGHDTATGDSYVMPEWVLYTSKNMTDWEYKGRVMSARDISWRSNDTSAWASQMVEYNGKYYLYYCTWDKTSGGRQSIGVACADKPEGPYKDPLGKPLVSGAFTVPESSNYNDIDPTVLIDTDKNGIEHRYLAWGNGKYYICELNEDMISIKDLDGDGEILMHKDVKERKIKSMNGGVFTEAPWLYKRDGKYYMFYAMNWREEMAYAMADEPFGRYDYKQTIMPPTATSNTNHPSVIDFGGKTYFIYHTGALPHGSGYRRSVCIQELEFDKNGYVIPLTETSIGLSGTASTILTSDNRYIGHSSFRNPLADSAYPLSVPVTLSDSENGYNTAWELVQPKFVPEGGNAKNYVSIQSVNKPGLYISASANGIVLTQDADGKQGEAMTFKTVKGLDGKADTVSFISSDGRYMTVSGNVLVTSYGTMPAESSFTIGTATQKDSNAVNVAAAEPEPTPAADLTQNFDLPVNNRLIYLQATDTPAYTDIEGVTLYIGTRSSGADAATCFAIRSGGVTGNALVLNAGNYQSASRGPRMQINTPAIPNGYKVTATLMVKQGSAGSVLRFNDSVSNESGTQISGLTTSWQALVITIANDNDLYTRTINLGGTEIASDYVGTFPVLWGTTENKTGQSIYFDNLSVVTERAAYGFSVDSLSVERDGSAASRNTNNTPDSAQVSLISASYDDEGFLLDANISSASIAPGTSAVIKTDALKIPSKNIKAFVWSSALNKPLSVYAAPESAPQPDAEFSFEGTLADSVSGESGVLCGEKVSLASSAQPSYTDGKDGSAVLFTGAGSYGIKLPVKLSGANYTISFDAKLNSATLYTPFVFIANYTGNALKGGDDNAQWISIAPQGWQTTLANGPMIWSRNIPGGSSWNDLYEAGNNSLVLNKWHNITVVAEGAQATVYVDKVKIASGAIADIVDDTTTIYLGVNDWDTPLDGAIDNLRIYNRALNAKQVSLIGE